MSDTKTADDRGRIVIPKEIREKYGDRYRVVELHDRIELVPVADDPVEGLRDAIGDAFEEKSISEIKREARAAARDVAVPAEHTGDQREHTGDQREHTGDQREHTGDQREHTEDQREHTEDQREQ